MTRERVCGGRWAGVGMRMAVSLAVAALLWVAAGAAIADPLTIPVTASDGTALGTITVDVSADGTGVVGDFTSSFGDPPSLAAAAQKNGEHHWNWHQQVVRDNHPPTDAAGKQLTPPYDDPPPGGYPGQWGDGLPWYWDEQPPPLIPHTLPEPPFIEWRLPEGYDPAYNLSQRTTQNRLDFRDFPSDDPDDPADDDTSLEFNTWLVSLNADGSLHSYHGGFAWTWDAPGSPNHPNNRRSVYSPGDIDQSITILGPLAPLPEPGTFVLLTMGSVGLLIRVRRRRAMRQAA